MLGNQKPNSILDLTTTENMSPGRTKTLHPEGLNTDLNKV